MKIPNKDCEYYRIEKCNIDNYPCCYQDKHNCPVYSFHRSERAKEDVANRGLLERLNLEKGG